MVKEVLSYVLKGGEWFVRQEGKALDRRWEAGSHHTVQVHFNCLCELG